MDLNKVYIILDHPDECRNIGAACRAMANNDIKHLRIVGKKEDYDIEKIHVLAIHAAYIYDSAEFFSSIKEATKDCTLAAGTTRRRGQNRKEKLFLPEEFAQLAEKITGSPRTDNSKHGCLMENSRQDLEKSFSTISISSTSNESNGEKVAVVFGNERTGLTDSQLEECTVGVTIPSSKDFGSLNLSHAVQIICYHLFRQNSGHITGYTPLNLQRIDKTVECIIENLQKIGFFKIAGKKDMQDFWRSLLSRAALSESEAKYLEKTFSKAAGLSTKNKLNS